MGSSPTDSKSTRTYVLILIVRFDDRPAVTFLLALEVNVLRVSRRFVGPQLDIALPMDLLHLLVLQVRLRYQKPGHAHPGHHQQDNLHRALPGVELRLRVDLAGREDHPDQHVEQGRSLRRRLGPVDAPLVDDADDEVSKNGLKEDHLRNEVGVDIREALETNVIGNLQTKSERHLDPP